MAEETAATQQSETTQSGPVTRSQEYTSAREEFLKAPVEQPSQDDGGEGEEDSGEKTVAAKETAAKETGAKEKEEKTAQPRDFIPRAEHEVINSKYKREKRQRQEYENFIKKELEPLKAKLANLERPAVPDKATDPDAYLEHKIGEVDSKAKELEARVKQSDAEKAAAQQYRELEERIVEAEGPKEKQPEGYFEAVQFASRRRQAELKAEGKTEAEIARQLQKDLIIALDTAEDTETPFPVLMMNQARAWGWAPKAKPVEKETKTAPAKSEIEEDIEAIQRGQRTQTPKGGGETDENLTFQGKVNRLLRSDVKGKAFRDGLQELRQHLR